MKQFILDPEKVKFKIRDKLFGPVINFWDYSQDAIS